MSKENKWEQLSLFTDEELGIEAIRPIPMANKCCGGCTCEQLS